MNKCNYCKNKDSKICFECLIVGGEQTYIWFEPIEENLNQRSVLLQ